MQAMKYLIMQYSHMSTTIKLYTDYNANCTTTHYKACSFFNTESCEYVVCKDYFGIYCKQNQHKIRQQFSLLENICNCRGMHNSVT